MNNVVQQLAARGVALRVCGGKLQARGAKPADKALIREHKAELLAALAAANDSVLEQLNGDMNSPQLDNATAPSAFAGVTYEDLENRLPAKVLGIPLRFVLEHADESDYQDLMNIETLAAFTRSLIHTGYLEPTQEYLKLEAWRKPEKSPTKPAVTCGQCRHFIPDPLNPSQGIGRCGTAEPVLPASAAAATRRALPHWPMMPRYCDRFDPRTADAENGNL